MALPASEQIAFNDFNFERGLGNVYTLDMAHAAYVYGVDTAGGISMDEFYGKEDIFHEYSVPQENGYGISWGAACTDASLNSRTLYSVDAPPSFGVGSHVFTDKYPTPLYNYSNVVMASESWTINAAGVVTGDEVPC